MLPNLVILEDTAHSRFLPLAHTRPVYELLCGAMSLRERIERSLGGEARLLCRSHLAEVTREAVARSINATDLRRHTPVVFVNGRLLDPEVLAAALAAVEGPAAWWNGDQPVAVRLAAAEAADLLMALESNDFVLEAGMLPKVERRLVAAHLVEYPWALVLQNGARIAADCAPLLARQRRVGLPAGVTVLGDGLLAAHDVEIDPTAVLDTRDGPILLGAGAHIAAHTRVEGPAAIARGAQLVGGKIRAGTTIGPGCRVGGEVETSIFHGHSNKYHDGFIGHAYVGEWVNLGALTTNSDLKNTYGPVKVWNQGRLRDTGESKVGVLIGDHTKTGIGTLLDTGTVIGVAANIFGGGLLRAKFVPSFSWGVPPELKLYDPVRCLATMQTVMERRACRLTPAYHELVDELYLLTAKERAFAGLDEPGALAAASGDDDAL